MGNALVIHFAFLGWNDRELLLKSKSTETYNMECFRIEFGKGSSMMER